MKKNNKILKITIYITATIIILLLIILLVNVINKENTNTDKEPVKIEAENVENINVVQDKTNELDKNIPQDEEKEKDEKSKGGISTPSQN